MMYIKLNKKQLINKVVKLTKQYDGMSKSYNDLLNKNEEAYNKIEDITQVKESIQLQNQTLEKRLLATEVELLRKIVSLYEKQPVQQPIGYNYPNSNGVSTTGTTITTASNTINGY